MQLFLFILQQICHASLASFQQSGKGLVKEMIDESRRTKELRLLFVPFSSYSKFRFDHHGRLARQQGRNPSSKDQIDNVVQAQE